MCSHGFLMIQISVWWGTQISMELYNVPQSFRDAGVGKHTLGIHYGNQNYIFNVVKFIDPLNHNIWVYKEFNWFKPFFGADFRRIHSAYNSARLLVPSTTTYLNRNNVVCLWRGHYQHHINLVCFLYRKIPRGFLCQDMALLIFLILESLLVLSI